MIELPADEGEQPESEMTLDKDKTV